MNTNSTKAGAHTPTPWETFIRLGTEAERAEHFDAMHKALADLLEVYHHAGKYTPQEKMFAVRQARAALAAAEGGV